MIRCWNRCSKVKKQQLHLLREQELDQYEVKTSMKALWMHAVLVK